MIQPGSKQVEEYFKDAFDRGRAASNVDRKKWEELFYIKVNYYENSPKTAVLLGMYGIQGYVGFAYHNEYLLFDKFYNNDKTKSILTHNEAIYGLPSDRFGLLCQTKQDILKERELDDRIKRVNHTKYFTNRLDEIIRSENVSTSTLEEEIKKEKNNVLIRRR